MPPPRNEIANIGNLPKQNACTHQLLVKPQKEGEPNCWNRRLTWRSALAWRVRECSGLESSHVTEINPQHGATFVPLSDDGSRLLPTRSQGRPSDRPYASQHRTRLFVEVDEGHFSVRAAATRKCPSDERSGLRVAQRRVFALADLLLNCHARPLSAAWYRSNSDARRPAISSGRPGTLEGLGDADPTLHWVCREAAPPAASSF